jgi:hypothetical protein
MTGRSFAAKALGIGVLVRICIAVAVPIVAIYLISRLK